ncbi:MAG: hypothetical protein KF795_16650 [Labilithrix sp.]|nr:hypothetical protein [Labilithrix sp.]
MSWSGAVPVDADQSDTRILIDACLARVREHVELDAEPVLPPLHALLGKPAASSAKRLVVGPSARRLPSAEAIVRSVAGRNTSTLSARREDATAKTRRGAHRMSWPVVLCGFIGALFGGMATMKSPVGREPAVQHVMTTAEGHVEAVYAATVAAKTRLVHR